MDAGDVRTRLQRSVGVVRVGVVARGDATALTEAYQQGAGKLRFPRGRGLEALVLNTSGGLASGDRFSLDVAVAGGTLTVSTPACERVYRAEGPPATVTQALSVASGATLHHLPQPTILYDAAALARRTRIDVAQGGRLLFVDGLVLGRAAHGERVETLAVADRTELWIDGRLRFVDALRLDDRALAARDEPAGLAGARGVGLVLALGVPDAVARLREALPETCAGVSLVNGVAVARILAPSHTALQDALAQAVQALGAIPPRAWAL